MKFTVSLLGQEQPIVQTSLGLIRGHHKRSYGGRTFSAFEGIPYAKPPIGDLRFKEPISIEPWSGIWEATMIYECLQKKLRSSDALGSEDCLYLYIYVPKVKPVPNENLDVIVHIHGGGFMIGSPKLAGPEYLMDRDVIYVNLNYRLGIFGFLSTQDDVVSGNNGMKDQVLALKWIKNHIKEFGGNPKSVTIIGSSAGGASVHLHYFSPLTKGLFHRGISQSGTALSPWVIQEAPMEMAKKLAAPVGCDTSSTKELVQCLKQRSAKQLIQTLHNFEGFCHFPIAPFAPVIERKFKGAFLPDYPYKLLKHGNVIDVPWITSATTEDGTLGVSPDFLKKLEDLNEHWNEALPYLLDYTYTVADADKLKVAEKIKQFYFGTEKVSRDNLQKLIKLVGDRYIKLDLEKSARLQVKVTNSSIYSSIYGYRGDHNFSNIRWQGNYYGVGHGEDDFLLYYVTFAGVTFKKEKLSDSDEKIKQLLLDIVTSFARNGKPSVKGIDWKPVMDDSSDFQYLFIHNNGLKMVLEKEIAPITFWRSLPISENENIDKVKDEL